jgi:uncharacterized SAM-binding protein YcdF (DUF218 family)
VLAARSETTTGDTGAPPRRGRLRVLAGLTGIMVVLFAAGFLWFVRLLPADETPPMGKADGIVALTGGASRISDALDLLATGHGQRLLITGVNPSTKISEIARLVPEHQRWFDCCVDLGYSALNTIGNAAETRRWTQDRGFRSLIVVTSNFHMPRAMAEISHQLPGVALTPFAVVSERSRVTAWWTNSATARLLFSEYLKYIVAVARMRLGHAFT